MNMRVILTGILGGVISSLALIPPLYFVLPARYTAHWPLVPPVLEGLGYALTLGVMVATGYVAARWGWASSTQERLKTGALTGALVGSIAFLGIGASAAGIIGSDLILRYGLHPAAGEADFLRLACESAVAVGYWTYLTSLGMLILGAALGALGGGIYAWQGTTGWGTAPRAISGEVWQTVAIVTMLYAAIMLMATLPIVGALAEETEGMSVCSGYTTILPIQDLIVLPLATNLVILLGATWWDWQRIGIGLGRPLPGTRRAAKVAVLLALGLPLATLGMVRQEYPGLFEYPLFVAGAIGWVAVTLIMALKAWRRPRVPYAPEKPALALSEDWGFAAILLFILVGTQAIHGPLSGRLLATLERLTGESIGVPTERWFMPGAGSVLLVMVVLLVRAWQGRRKPPSLDDLPVTSFREWLDFVVLCPLLLVGQTMIGLAAAVLSGALSITPFVYADEAMAYAPRTYEAIPVAGVLQSIFETHWQVNLVLIAWAALVAVVFWVVFWIVIGFIGWVVEQVARRRIHHPGANAGGAGEVLA